LIADVVIRWRLSLSPPKSGPIDAVSNTDSAACSSVQAFGGNMQRLERLPAPEELGQNILKQREAAVKMEKDAIAVGDKCEAKNIAKIIRKYDKLISDYNLDSYSDRT